MSTARWALVAISFLLMAWGIWAGATGCAPLVAGRSGAIAVALGLGFLFLGDDLPSRVLEDETPGGLARGGSGITEGDKAKQALQQYFYRQKRDRWPLVLVTGAGTLLWAYSDLVPVWLGVCG